MAGTANPNDRMTKYDRLPKVIYVMGAPGAGKGTQAKMLCEEIGYINFSTGNAFREASRQNTPLGRSVRETINAGFLAPPEMAAEIVIAAVRKHIKAGRGLVFDGTPRTVEEARIVDDFFAAQDYGRPLVLYLNLAREEMIKRNSIRKFCLGIKGDFPVMKPEDEEQCLKEGGRIGTRPDDLPEKFSIRWDQFMQRTFPVVEQYRQQGIVREVDGMKAISEVHQAIMEIINTKF
jgi:adenylate kinase